MTIYLGKDMNYIIYNKGKRENNEDFYRVYEHNDKTIIAVADGVGGYNAGEIASRIAVDTVCEYFENWEINLANITEAFIEANMQILSGQEKHPGMKSTLVALFVSGDNAYVANVGDSRAYQVRDNSLIFKSKDHSLVRVLADAGVITEDEMETHEDRNKILRAMGIGKELRVDITELDVEDDDWFILTTDGFWQHISDKELMQQEDIIKWFKGREDYILNTDLIEQDNFTAVLYRRTNENRNMG